MQMKNSNGFGRYLPALAALGVVVFLGAAGIEAAECQIDLDCVDQYGLDKSACTAAGVCVACKGSPGANGQNAYCPSHKPYCHASGTAGASCLECLTSAHCTAAAEPICTSTPWNFRECEPCSSDSECQAKGPGLKRCGTLGTSWPGRCVSCLEDDDCQCAAWPMVCNTDGFFPKCERDPDAGPLEE